jgi:hypothetical protein
MTSFNVRKPRPRVLSDPHGEYFGGTAKHLAIADSDLQWHHYKLILGPYFPAGTYEESVYFLPLAFNHLLNHPDDALDLVTTPIWFASEFVEDLRRDGLLNPVRDRIRDCFVTWTREFHVIHFDQEACRAKGWGVPYSDYVNFSEVICQGMEDLARFNSHADLALEFFRSLSAAHANPVNSAWLLYLSHAQTAAYPPPDDPAIREILNDKALLQSAAETVRSTVAPAEPSPTYWRDVFAELNL